MQLQKMEMQNIILLFHKKKFQPQCYMVCKKKKAQSGILRRELRMGEIPLYSCALAQNFSPGKSTLEWNSKNYSIVSILGEGTYPVL